MTTVSGRLRGVPMTKGEDPRSNLDISSTLKRGPQVVVNFTTLEGECGDLLDSKDLGVFRVATS